MPDDSKGCVSCKCYFCGNACCFMPACRGISFDCPDKAVEPERCYTLDCEGFIKD